MEALADLNSDIVQVTPDAWRMQHEQCGGQAASTI